MYLFSFPPNDMKVINTPKDPEDSEETHQPAFTVKVGKQECAFWLRYTHTHAADNVFIIASKAEKQHLITYSIKW